MNQKLFLIPEKSCVYYSYYTNIKEVEISHVLFNKVAPLTLTRRPFEHGTSNCQRK